jgi:hypothetical protein
VFNGFYRIHGRSIETKVGGGGGGVSFRLVMRSKLQLVGVMLPTSSLSDF